MDKYIISAIESELEYQNEKLASVGLTNETHTHSAPEWLLIIELQVAKAKEKWYRGEHLAVSDQFRKIAATAVVAMGQCGITLR
jgi:Ni,Fe-hydrogenase I small subunit